MRRFHDLPLDRKLTLIVMLATVAAMLLSAIAIISYQVHTVTRFIISELETTAEMLGANGSAALRFKVPRDAHTTLSSLEFKSHISGACFFTPEEKMFATYSRDGKQLPAPNFSLKDGHTFDFARNSVILVKHIHHDGDFIGSLHIQSDLDVFYDQLTKSIATTLLIIIVCSTLALILALKLLRVVSQPIRSLVNTVNQVSAHGDYALRAKQYSDDDLGKLTEGFNEMLDQIQSYREHLEELVDERTAALESSNEHLLQEINDRIQAEDAQRQAKTDLEIQRSLSIRSDRLRSLGEMAAGIAHELNQPLVGVRGLAEHLLISMERGWEVTDDKVKGRLSGIVKQADRMVHIIDHVRMFAREAGKPDLSDICVNDVVNSSVDMRGAQFRSTGVDLQTDLSENLPLVLANPFSLEEVVINLLNNSRDAVGEQNGNGFVASVSVMTRIREADSGPEVVIDVQDKGGGVPDDILARIWDPFFTTKDPDKGTGLGLSISKGIVEEFGGSMSIDSRPGDGTTVSILLPAVNHLSNGVSNAKREVG